MKAVLKDLVGEHENKAGEDRIPNCNAVISEAEMSTFLVLLRESDISESCGRNTAELGKEN